MKIPRVLWILLGGVGLIALAWLVFFSDRDDPERQVDQFDSTAFDQIPVAVQAYALDRRRQSQPLPEFVSLEQLAEGGYLSTNVVEQFEKGARFLFNVRASETNPTEIIARAVYPDGQEDIALGDGSVQSSRAEKLKETLRRHSSPEITQTNNRMFRTK